METLMVRKLTIRSGHTSLFQVVAQQRSMATPLWISRNARTFSAE